MDKESLAPRDSCDIIENCIDRVWSWDVDEKTVAGWIKVLEVTRDLGYMPDDLRVEHG